MAKDDNGFMIDEDFLNYESFRNTFIDVLFNNYLNDIKRYISENAGLDINTIHGINNILLFLDDIDIIRSIAEIVDGKVEECYIPNDENPNIKRKFKRKKYYYSSPFIVRYILFYQV